MPSDDNNWCTIYFGRGNHAFFQSSAASTVSSSTLPPSSCRTPPFRALVAPRLRNMLNYPFVKHSNVSYDQQCPPSFHFVLQTTAVIHFSNKHLGSTDKLPREAANPSLMARIKDHQGKPERQQEYTLRKRPDAQYFVYDSSSHSVRIHIPKRKSTDQEQTQLHHVPTTSRGTGAGVEAGASEQANYRPPSSPFKVKKKYKQKPLAAIREQQLPPRTGYETLKREQNGETEEKTEK